MRKGGWVSWRTMRMVAAGVLATVGRRRSTSGRCGFRTHRVFARVRAAAMQYAAQFGDGALGAPQCHADDLTFIKFVRTARFIWRARVRRGGRVEGDPRQ